MSSALYDRITRTYAAVVGLLLFLILIGTPAAHSFKGALASEPAAFANEVRNTCQEYSASSCFREVAGMITDSPADSVCRTRYEGTPPEFAPPPAYVVDVPLPSIYCGNVNQWVFVYPSRAGVQFYRLDPSKRESYLTIFSEASKGTTTPLALRRIQSGEVTYFVNMEPARTRTFDYTVSARRFDVCL